jgi:ParB family chromosome partitioning protein
MDRPVDSPSQAPLIEIPIERLAPDPFQPRTHFTEETIRELADSIHQHGLLQPLLVRPMQGLNSRGRYWIVGGERRYRAAQLLGMKALPCRVQPYENLAAAVVALAENVHREDLGDLDKAAALLRIKTLTDRTWDEVAELVKLSRDYVKRLAGLLSLDDSVKELVRAGRIPIRTAIALRPLPVRRQAEMAERILAEGLTAEQVRAEVQRLKSARGRKAPAPPPPDASPLARARTVTGGLQECRLMVEAVGTWIDDRDWSPSRLSEQQAAALEQLHEAVSLLHQQLLAVRRPLPEQNASEADRLRRADLPF